MSCNLRWKSGFAKKKRQPGKRASVSEVRTSSKFSLSTFKNCWDRLRSLPSRRAFREFHSVYSYVLHIRYGADQSNGNFFIIPPSCEKLSLRRFRVRSPWLECFAEYYFRISIRTLNSNDHFTFPASTTSLSFTHSLIPPLFSLSLPPPSFPPLSAPLCLLVSIELWSKHTFQHLLSLNILSKCFSFITYCTPTRIHSNQYLIQCQSPFLLPFFLHGLALVSFAFTEIPVVSCAANSWIAFSVK